MSRFKLVLAGICSLAIVGGTVTASPVFAAEFTLPEAEECGVPGFWTICDLNTAKTKWFAVKGKSTITGTKLKAGTKSKLAVTGLATIVCTAATAQATIEQENVLVSAFTIKKLGIKFTGCTVEGHESECTAQSGTMPGEVVVEELVAGEVLDEGDGLPVPILFSAETGAFVTIKVTTKSGSGTKCPATITSVTGETTGSVLCQIPSPEAEKTVATLVCSQTSTEDELLYAEKPAVFSIEEEFELEGKYPIELLLA